MHIRNRWLGIATFVLAASTLTVHADTLDVFTLTSGADTATWSVPVPVMPGFVYQGSFELFAPITFDGMNTSSSSETFLEEPNLTVGFDVSGTDYFYSLFVPHSYGGFSGAPVFRPGTDTFVGTFTITSASGSSVSEDVSGEFTVSEVSTPDPVPEPSTLALLGTGLVSVFGLIRRRYA